MSGGGRFIALDLGASSGRVVVGEVSNKAFTLREIHRFDNVPVTLRGHLYWDFPALYRELLAGLRVYRELYGRPPTALGSIRGDATSASSIAMATWFGFPVTIVTPAPHERRNHRPRFRQPRPLPAEWDSIPCVQYAQSVDGDATRR